ncbi:signal peptidase I SipW [Fictibacillus gelatini]|uniref:signal peptidase I SipW n=1 Tax=Fictibacillus gelatini TaxID=225985 RepID=UPI0003F5FF3F|nr:signal peptidase I [Fictibacillus gelatini]
MKKVLKLTSGFVSIIMIVVFICLSVVVISAKASGGEPTIMGYQVKTVLSGSMEPTFMTGSIIAIQPKTDGENYKKGDIITFREKNNKLITHRIIDVQKVNGQVMYKTKGDNNNAADRELVLSQNTVGKYVNFTIPYIGYLLNYANTKTGSALLMIVPGIFLVIYSVVSMYSSIREIDENKKKLARETSQSV